MISKPSSQDPVAFPQEKKQRTLLIILVVLVLVSLIILYFGFWRSKPLPASVVSSSETTASEIATIEGIIKKIDFDFDFLENSLFQDLKVYGEWPLEIKEKGRTNPFSSF